MDHFSIAMLNFSRVHAIPLDFFGEEKDIWDGHIFWCLKMTGVPHLGFVLRHLSYTATQSLLLHCMLQSYMKKWVCLKMGYTPNYSHLIGIMIINHWVFRGTQHFQTNPNDGIDPAKRELKTLQIGLRASTLI